MENQNDLYLAFISQNYYFLIPLSWVKIVKDGEDMGELPTLDFSEMLEEEHSLKEKRYLVVMGHGEEEFGILVDHVLELCEIPKGAAMKLRSPVMNDKNRYLSGAVHMELNNEQKLAYILEPEVLYTMCIDRRQGGL